VLIPAGKIATGKLAQALVHGARPLQVAGNFDDCLALASKIALDYPVALVNSVNVDRLHGQKTAAFEIVEALSDAPDIHCLPVGNAGNITAYWMGYVEEHDAGHTSKRPKMCGFRPAEQRPLWTVRSYSSRPRLPPRSGSETRHRGRRRSMLGTSPAV
jgi:threonine synthase